MWPWYDYGLIWDQNSGHSTFSIIPSAPKGACQAGFETAEPPREAMSLPGCIPQGERLGYS